MSVKGATPRFFRHKTMSLIKNLRVGARLGLCFGSLLLMTVIVAVVGYIGLERADQYMTDIVLDNNVKAELLQDMSEQVHIVSRVLRTVVLLHEGAEMEAQAGKIVAARDAYDRARATLEKLPASAEGKTLRDRIASARQAARAVNDQVLALARANKDAEALALLLNVAAPKVAVWQAALDDYIAFQRQETREAHEVAHAADIQAERILMAVTLLSIGLGAGTAWWVARSITGPIRRAVDAAGRIAQGDLSQEIRVESKDETGALLEAMREMQRSLTHTVASVRGNAESVATASAQIAQGNLDLSQRTESQASALEQTAATMNQLGSTVTSNADNARQANQLAHAASNVAQQGGVVVGEVVQTMKGINDSSRQIAEIIGTIDSIAFQTNILALNAAVEAARAGEQGRGFAVVASEVRGLAQRSAEAAREIKALIGASVERVEQGSALVNRAGATMGEVVDAIQRVTDIMGEITHASAEQAGGVSQVGQAVTQMDRVTQQNAALVEESAAAAQSLKGQAQALVQAVAVFKLAPGA
jgi:methyl-accepting chemotaxis protein